MEVYDDDFTLLPVHPPKPAATLGSAVSRATSIDRELRKPSECAPSRRSHAVRPDAAPTRNTANGCSAGRV